MAIKQGTESFMKWVHMENGKTMVRRIHRLEVQARNGQLYILKGDKLPDTFVSQCGEGLKGEHLGQILLKPESMPKRTPCPAPNANPWPCWRDIMSLGIGFFGFVIFKFVVSLFEACL